MYRHIYYRPRWGTMKYIVNSVYFYPALRKRISSLYFKFLFRLVHETCLVSHKILHFDSAADIITETSDDYSNAKVDGIISERKNFKCSLFIFLHSGRRPTGAKRPSAGCPECICNRPRLWRRPCVSDWGCGAVILLSRGEFGREKNKICYQRGCVWTFCYMPNL